MSVSHGGQGDRRRRNRGKDARVHDMNPGSVTDASVSIRLEWPWFRPHRETSSRMEATARLTKFQRGSDGEEAKLEQMLTELAQNFLN